MELDFVEIFILSAIQGISEFLPISSSAHIFLISEIKNFSSQSLFVDIGLHLGSLLAIIIYFRKDLLSISKDKSLLILLVAGSIPLVVIGAITYYSGLIYYLRNIETVAYATLIFAFFLYFADKFEVKKKISNNLSLKSICIIGILQALAVIPGVSRSGIVITAGRFLNFSRYDSTKISLFLSIPAIMGASFLMAKDLFEEGIEFGLVVVFSIILSFIFSYMSIKYFLIFVKKFSLNLFVVYRIVLSLILFVIIYN